jgi:hypothetical protein
MTEHRVSCPKHHWLFSITLEGIAIKCRAGECRQVYIVTWAELDAKRQEAKCGIVAEKGDDDHGCIHTSWKDGGFRLQEGRQGSKTETPEKEEIA